MSNQESMKEDPAPWSRETESEQRTRPVYFNPPKPNEPAEKQLLEKLLLALTERPSTEAKRYRVHEPDLFYGERSSLAVSTWLDSLTTYYELVQISDEEKTLYASTLLRGDAQLWWSRLKNNEEYPANWEAFCHLFADEFKPLNSELAARDRLAALFQHGTVSRYISDFRSVQLQISDLSKGDALDKFIRGLQKPIRVAVRTRCPNTLSAAETMALAIESATDGFVHIPNSDDFGIRAQNVSQRMVSPSLQPTITDDPMDLDAIRAALNAIGLSRSKNSRWSAPPKEGKKVRCYGCNGYGHIKRECPTWIKNGAGNRRGDRYGNEASQNKSYDRLNAVFHTNHQEQASRSKNLIDLNYDVDVAQLNKDSSYLLNMENKDTELPLYVFDLFIKDRVHKVKALLDTGASANYISSHLIHDGMKVISLPKSRVVETAGGHTIEIKNKVEFCLAIHGLSYTVEAYVFEMKFDLILGQQWFRQACPVPHWPDGSWILSAPSNVDKITLYPVQDEYSGDSGLHYLVSKKQLQRYVKKDQLEEVFMVLFSDPSQGGNETSATRVSTLTELLREFNDVFRDHLPPGLPPARYVEHVIDTGNAKPKSRPPFKMSPRELDELRKQLKELLDLGLIRPSSSSWGAPVLFVRKKDGNLRMCIDYRAVNSVTSRLNTPLPRIDECLDRLGGANFFSSIDLKSGYHQVRIKEDDIPKTAFNTRYGSFEFMVLPFGLTNSPPTFQKMMNSILGEFIDKFVLVYLDDILIYSKSQKEHTEHIHQVLSKLREHKLFANPKKCFFNRTHIEFLGYRVSSNGILPSESKIAAIRDWPRLSNVQEVRQFIGLCSHYRRFIPGFSSVAAPLTDQTKGSGPKRRPILWSQKCQEAFDCLKSLMSSSPVLQHPDLNKPFIIETDASDLGVGAVLLQRDANDILHPLAYESKKLSDAEKGYPVQERELLAVLHALRVWRCFIEGTTYTVYTDHNPLQYLRSTTKPTPRLVRWLAEFETYDPIIKYKPGKENVVPDALSRCPSSSGKEVLGLEPDYLYVAKALPDTDWPMYYMVDVPDGISDLMKRRIEKEKDKFVVQEGQVWRKVKFGTKDTLVQFCPFSRRADLIARFHEGFGHAGQGTVFDLLKKRWWWPTMPTDISSWLSSCPRCQLASGAGKGKHHAPMVSSDVPPAFTRWHLDFIGELPTTKRGNRWLLTAVDFSTNWPIARALPEATAEAVADFIYEEIVMRFGCPVEIVTDRGANFTSKLVKHYSERIKTTHKLTSAFHPRTNGKCERLNGILKTMLRKFVHGAIHMWDEYVDAALFASRIRRHRTAGYSPFYLVYEREPRIPGDLFRPYLISAVANDSRTVAEHTARELEDLGQARAAAHKRMVSVSEYDKKRWDALITKIDYEIGDHVLLRNEQKYGLEYNWMGPYLVVDKNEDSNIYKLVTIGGEPYQSWVHVDRLKEVKAESIQEAWYNPTVSRAAWRREMGLSAGGQVDQSRSKGSGGNDVVSTNGCKFKPTIPIRTSAGRT
ncbi:hypothetical protein G6F56_003781 [Rhizopus delemar]|nr:hypothetical protein G6F56_003781 [Rhizopus delemar]